MNVKSRTRTRLTDGHTEERIAIAAIYNDSDIQMLLRQTNIQVTKTNKHTGYSNKLINRLLKQTNVQITQTN
jgi:hypothetical protein